MWGAFLGVKVQEADGLGQRHGQSSQALRSGPFQAFLLGLNGSPVGLVLGFQRRGGILWPR